MAIMKTIEITAESEKSWEAATREAVKAASKSVDNIKSVWVQDQTCSVKGGEVDKFPVRVKITFSVDR